MKGLTAKEEEIMGFFWEKGPLFVKEMLASMKNRSRILTPYQRLCAGWKIKAFWLIIFLGILINTIRSSVKKIFVKEHFGM